MSATAFPDRTAGDVGGRSVLVARLTLVAHDPDRLAALELPGHKLARDLRDPEACELAVAAARRGGGRVVGDGPSDLDRAPDCTTSHRHRPS